MMYWLIPVVILGARFLWQGRPGLLTASIFWLASFILVVTLGWTSAPSHLILTLGILSNAAVTLANGGFMPVAMHRRTSERARSLWVERTSSQRLLFLADNFGTQSFRFSVGDVLLALGILMSAAGL
jgi:hypothetical protein